MRTYLFHYPLTRFLTAHDILMGFDSTQKTSSASYKSLIRNNVKDVLEQKMNVTANDLTIWHVGLFCDNELVVQDLLIDDFERNMREFFTFLTATFRKSSSIFPKCKTLEDFLADVTLNSNGGGIVIRIFVHKLQKGRGTPRYLHDVGIREHKSELPRFETYKRENINFKNFCISIK